MDCGPHLYPFVSDDLLVIKRTLLNVDEYDDSPSERELAKRLDALTLDFSSTNAAFICSGPFKLMLTISLENHLLLDEDGYLQIFWDFEREPGARLGLLEYHFFWDYESQNTG